MDLLLDSLCGRSGTWLSWKDHLVLGSGQFGLTLGFGGIRLVLGALGKSGIHSILLPYEEDSASVLFCMVL